MSIPTSSLPLHWGGGILGLPSCPGFHPPNLPHWGLQSCPEKPTSCSISQSCPLPSLQHSAQTWSFFQQNGSRRVRSSLFGGRRGQGGAWEPGLQTHLLAVAGESLEAAEGRPGLSDHRQQGRRLLEGQREEAREQDMTTVRRQRHEMTATDTERQGKRQEGRDISVLISKSRPVKSALPCSAVM